MLGNKRDFNAVYLRRRAQNIGPGPVVSVKRGRVFSDGHIKSLGRFYVPDKVENKRIAHFLSAKPVFP